MQAEPRHRRRSLRVRIRMKPTGYSDMKGHPARIVAKPQADRRRMAWRARYFLIVDVRDAAELISGGKIKGAAHVTRGMLEFRADPESPYHNPYFQKDKTVLVCCASGGRAALSGEASKDLGYSSDFNRRLRRAVRRGDRDRAGVTGLLVSAEGRGRRPGGHLPQGTAVADGQGES